MFLQLFILEDLNENLVFSGVLTAYMISCARNNLQCLHDNVLFIFLHQSNIHSLSNDGDM